MYKNFLNPIKIIICVYMVGGLGIASDIAQLSDFNILDFINKYSPQSYYYLIAITLLLYFILVFIELIQKKPAKQLSKLEHNPSQIIKARNVKNSTIIQINKDKGE